MLPFLLALLACGSPPAEPADPPGEGSVVGAAEASPAEASPAEASVGDAPMGRIGGDPIVPKPSVVGGIAAEAVEEGVAAVKTGIDQCYEAERAAKPDLKGGKVLVKFVIAKNGTVTSTSTTSTSLRHPAVETCVEKRVAEAKFAALERGETAVVYYPFVFGG